MKELVIFDLDGTLTNTSYDICDNVNLALKHFGYDEITLGETVKFVGNGAKKLVERALKGQKPDNFDEILAYYNLKYNYCGSPKTYVYPGMKEVVQKLKKSGYKCVIASNKPQAGTDEVCKQFFPDIQFDYVFGQREGIKVKPCRESIDFILKEVGVSPENAVFVGDSEVDALTYINAGIDGISVLWGYRSKEELEGVGATRFAESAEELYRMILAL